MSTTLVDSNVLIDIITDDPTWADWSVGHLDAAALLGPVVINDIIYAEVSVRMPTIEDLDAILTETAISLSAIPRSALFLAGKAFARYRAAGGTRTGVLADFFIGAHATVMDWALLTRDSGRFATYFPRLRLVTPP